MIQNTTSKPLTFTLFDALAREVRTRHDARKTARKQYYVVDDIASVRDALSYDRRDDLRDQIYQGGKSDDEKKSICRALERNRKLKRTVTREHAAVHNCGMEEVPGPVESAYWEQGEASGEMYLVCDPERRGGFRKVPFKNGTMMVCVMRGGRRVNIRAKDAKREAIFNDEGKIVGYEYLEPIYSEYRQIRSAQHQARMTSRFKGSQKAFEIWCASNQIRMDDHVY